MNYEFLNSACALSDSVELPTRSIGFDFVWEKLFGPERSSRLQLGFGKLRQVCHHRVLIHIWIHNLLRGDYLERKNTTTMYTATDYAANIHLKYPQMQCNM